MAVEKIRLAYRLAERSRATCQVQSGSAVWLATMKPLPIRLVDASLPHSSTIS
ncbi:hypothetical protein BH23ACT5_BH23ACT5_00490 [soil metagenome]